MSNVPDGAQLSEDGQWWWDDSSQTWKAVSGDPGGGQTPEAGQAGAAGGGAAPSSSGSGATPEGSASSEWPPAGYPADPEQWTDEQKQYWFGGAYDASVDFDVQEPEEVAVADIEGASDSGTEVA
jgi:hypothetical protein